MSARTEAKKRKKAENFSFRPQSSMPHAMRLQATSTLRALNDFKIELLL